ncbi:uncharacterized protein LOC129196991 [Grus americana]|uniref:uncharacterized protein LOC129196991 n=1 Tax=Grus americana TaxID=9117 RepID=UPI002407E784|nr:uncharacterized protein LOC129196991 [Grus americana]
MVFPPDTASGCQSPALAIHSALRGIGFKEGGKEFISAGKSSCPPPPRGRAPGTTSPQSRAGRHGHPASGRDLPTAGRTPDRRVLPAPGAAASVRQRGSGERRGSYSGVLPGDPSSSAPRRDALSGAGGGGGGCCCRMVTPRKEAIRNPDAPSTLPYWRRVSPETSPGTKKGDRVSGFFRSKSSKVLPVRCNATLRKDAIRNPDAPSTLPYGPRVSPGVSPGTRKGDRK